MQRVDQVLTAGRLGIPHPHGPVPATRHQKLEAGDVFDAADCFAVLRDLGLRPREEIISACQARAEANLGSFILVGQSWRMNDMVRPESLESSVHSASGGCDSLISKSKRCMCQKALLRSLP